MNNSLFIYKTPDGKTRLECRFQEENLWLSLNQLADLFERDKSVISKHLKNIFKDAELVKDSVVANHATTAADGKSYQVDYYNLEFAELQALNRKPMHMADWGLKLDDFLKLGDNELLTHAGKISATQAKEKAHLEYDKFRKVTDTQPSQIDRDLEATLKKLNSGEPL
ncbi:MAG: virulence RhuM family protein [Verrucomicrobiales bacterium]|nr:virulence RhuM family protein [Verrucomicrobiales bacterium]